MQNKLSLLAVVLLGVMIGISITFLCQPKPAPVAPVPPPVQNDRSFFGQSNIDQQNFLINGGFDFMQWGDPVNGLAIARNNFVNGNVNNFFSADRWVNYTTDVNGSAMVVKRSANTNSNASPNMMNVSQFDNGFPSGGHKVIFGQVVEHNWGLPLAGQNGGVVTFQASFQSGVSTPIRMAILEWTGTTDSVFSTGFVQDFTHSADADVSITGTGHFFTTNVIVHQDSGATSITSAKSLSLTATVSAGVHNIICVFWETTAVGVGNSWNAYECGLYAGAAPHQTWKPRNPGAELTICQRYFEKSYDVDTKPGSTITGSSQEPAVVMNGTASNQHSIAFIMHVSKRTNSPSITEFSAGGGVVSRGDSIDGSLNFSSVSSVVAIATSNIVIIQLGSNTVSAGIGANWCVSSEL